MPHCQCFSKCLHFKAVLSKYFHTTWPHQETQAEQAASEASNVSTEGAKPIAMGSGGLL